MPAPWTRDIIIGRLKELIETQFSDVSLWGYPTTPKEAVDRVRIKDPAENLEGQYKDATKTIPVVITITSQPKASEELARASAVDNMGILLEVLGTDRKLKNINGGIALIDGMLPRSNRTDIDNEDVAKVLATATINIDIIHTADAFTM